MKQKPAPKRVSPAAPKPSASPLPRPARFPTRDLLYALAIVAAGFAVYWRSLHGPFLFDDADLFEVRSSVRLRDWGVILAGPRPLLILSYVLNRELSGFDPFSFHLVSVVLHIINTLILWRIVRLLCASPGLSQWLTARARSILAVFVPLLFLTTPVATESVSYVSSRSELLAAAFYLLGMWAFFAAWREKRPWLAAFLIAFLYGCSVTSKQHAITLPAALLLADYFFFAAQDWRKLKANWRIYAVLGLEMLVGGFIVVRNVIHVPSAGFFLKDVTWRSYLFTQFRMYFLYLRVLLVPFGLNADYDIQPSRTLFQHGAWLALAGLLLLVAAALYFRRRFALASFGTLFFFLTLAPTSTFFPLLDYAAERRLYLPAIGFFLAALALLCEWRVSQRALAVLFGAVLVIYCAGTIARNAVWSDGLALWLDTAQKSPHKYRVYTWLGFEYSNRKMFPEATAAYQKAAALVPPRTKEQAEVLSSLGSTYNNRHMYAEAIGYYQAALKITPDIATLWTNLAVAELRLNRHEGWSDFERAIAIDPLAWEPHFARGNLLYQMGRYDLAIKDYERVLQLIPNHPDALHNLRAAQAMAARQKSAGAAP
ncbi:MAG TPA: tetratricopeptide repeat protein [Bryobacterales bacterium]|nr:tetratricopeptide repeat protein [Bryobacterales bacterium]